MPSGGELLRIPYSDIEKFQEKDYSIHIDIEDGRKISASQMGSRYDPFKKMLSELMNGLSLKAQWKADVMDLLKFNVSAKDDGQKWKKAQDSENTNGG